VRPLRDLAAAFWRSEKLGWRAARASALLYVGVLLMLVLLENRLIFQPTKYPGGGDWSVTDARPASSVPERKIVPRIEDVELTTDDGVRLHGWYAVPVRKGKNGVLAPVAATATILYLHGNAGNVTSRRDSLERLVTLPANVFIPDWRGYGKSRGSPSEDGLYRDARAAWRYLTRARGEAPGRIVLLGESLGNAPAILLATEEKPAGLIVQAAFTSLPDMARHLYPFVPRFLVRTRMENLARIGRVRCPLLFVHSKTDEIIPYEQGRKLFDAAPDPKRFYTVAGAGHNDLDSAGGDDYLRALRNFVEDYANKKAAD